MIDFELPQNLEAERYVIGSILTEPELFENCALTGKEFSDGRNRRIYETFQALKEDDRSITLVTLAEEAGDGITGLGGITYLVDLSSKLPTTAGFEEHVKIVQETHMKRRTLTTMLEGLQKGANAKDIGKYIAEMQSSLDEITDGMKPEKEFQGIGEMLYDLNDEIQRRSEQKGMSGYPTAGEHMDRLTGGHMKQDLIILAARPSIGKTAFMLHTAKRVSESGVVSAIFSLEMPGKKLVERLISNEGNIDGMMLKTGRLDDWSKYTVAAGTLHDLPIFIDDTPAISVQEIGRKVKSLKKKHPELMVFVDYLQLIDGGRRFSNKVEEVGYISGYLKKIARENDCPVMAISSLSRSCEQRQDKRPMLSDLRESGKIEFDADDVILLYRDDYYDGESEKKNIIEINLAKGRNTGTGTVEMAYMRNFNKFVDLTFGRK